MPVPPFGTGEWLALPCQCCPEGPGSGSGAPTGSGFHPYGSGTVGACLSTIQSVPDGLVFDIHLVGYSTIGQSSCPQNALGQKCCGPLLDGKRGAIHRYVNSPFTICRNILPDPSGIYAFGGTVDLGDCPPFDCSLGFVLGCSCDCIGGTPTNSGFPPNGWAAAYTIQSQQCSTASLVGANLCFSPAPILLYQTSPFLMVLQISDNLSNYQVVIHQ